TSRGGAARRRTPQAAPARARAPRVRSETQSSSPGSFELQEPDEPPEPVAGRRDGHVRHAAGAEELPELTALGGSIPGELRAQPAVSRVDLQLLPRLEVDQPDDADVGKLLFARVADLHRNDLVSGREPQQWPSPVERPAKVRDRHDQRPAA